MKTISVLGSTGSIGTQTLEVAREQEGRIKIFALTANSQVELLEKQIREFKPELAVMMDEAAAAELKARVSDLPVKVLCRIEGLIEAAAAEPVEMVVTAVSGSIGLEPTLAALQAGKDIALANKETLVAAGELVTATAKMKGCKILPVDSEHSAIFQCLEGRKQEPGERNGEAEFRKQEFGDRNQTTEFRRQESRIGSRDPGVKIILTASGGPFFGWTREQLARVTPAMALKHPNWAMGAKITIDSATMMNKGLEVIEAHHLFGVDYDRIEVLIHRQSIVHSMVEYRDGSVLAQLGMPDMRLPIQYALSYPERWQNNFAGLSLAGKNLSFDLPDHEAFPALQLAYSCGRTGGTLPAVMNAANEICVHAFLKCRIEYHEMFEITQRTCMDHKPEKADSLQKILAADSWARQYAEERIAQRKKLG